MIARDALTKIFLQQWGVSSDDINVKHYSRIWWNSSRVNSSSFRLSYEGFEFITDVLKLSTYEIPLVAANGLSPQTIIFLDRYVDCPYYLTYNSIFVTSELKHFELIMFSDDIRKYGLIKAMNSRKEELDES